MEATDARHVRLDLAHVLLVNEPDVRNLVRRRAPEELVEGPEFLLRGGDDEFAATLVRNVLFVAVPIELGAALDAEARLQ